MKTPARILSAAALASFLALTAAAWAQDQNPPAPPPAAAPTAAPASSDSATHQTRPAADAAATKEPTAAAATEAPAPAAPAAAVAEPNAAPAAAPVPAAPAEPASSELRRLDTVPAADQPAKADAASPATDTVAAAPAAPSEPAPSHPHRRQPTGNARVAIWHDSSLGKGEAADAVVSVLGSSTSAGDVGDAVVSVFGSSTSSGNVGSAVVSVLGNTTVTDGEVGEAAVAVLGNAKINGKIHGQVVAVMGNVELGPKAEVSGEVVCIGGKVIKDAEAVTHGTVNNVQFGFDFGDFAWLHAWVRHCLILGRPLAFASGLGWAWGIAFGFFALYLVLALLFPRGVTKCAETFEQRPGYSILTAFLVTLLTPAAAILLLITVIGTPALIVGLVVAGLFGKAVMLAWIGRRITLRLGDGLFAKPVFAVLIGGIIALLIYTIPFVGFLASKLLSWLGLGVVIYTLIQASKRPKAPRAVSGTAVPLTAVASPAGGFPTPNLVGGTGLAAGEPPVSSPAPVVISAVALPRAGFWIRLASALLDVLVIGIALHMLPFERLPHWAQPNFVLLFATYNIVFWALRGTTLGGIVCGLKVVRLDDRPVDWVTALVRALGAFLSLIAIGLGFIWVAFDDQKQSWHDKIAGTTIVRVPRGVSLV